MATATKPATAADTATAAHSGKKTLNRSIVVNKKEERSWIALSMKEAVGARSDRLDRRFDFMLRACSLDSSR
uniref:Uncharacterized protein n=1 Tax=Oryza punctata TaxID=4537 RepID=A0A0E0K313_ORYPU